MNEDLDSLQFVTENIDNFLRKNNIGLCGLKESTEGYDLFGYLEELFTGVGTSMSRLPLMHLKQLMMKNV